MELSGITILILLILTVIAVIVAIKAHYSEERAAIEKDYNKKFGIEEYKSRELQKEVEHLNQEKEKYIQFLISIPDIVKNFVSNLSFEETVSSIIRLTILLVDPKIIELYVFDKMTNSLTLAIAYNSKRKNKRVLKVGEGVVGLAAENRMLVSRTSQFPSADDGIDIAAPILFKDRLMGVIGLGKIKAIGGNEKRFISMIADLAGVSLQNCTYLETAKEEAITDPLTGLYNRRHFFEKSKEAAQKAISQHSPISIFIFDIDHFKRYNDINGHGEGDQLLMELSRLIKENSRDTDVAARFGGEEFIILMPNTDKDSALLYAEEIRKLIERYPFNHREKQQSGYVSISGGVATFPVDGNSFNAVIKHADEALYESKRSGRNKVTRYEPFNFSMAL
ncbi:MAG TPA: GGDEF domain-containing protein [Thermodesulfovibrionales bacterium]|nr:GGDEF domain-containing protein [Thermodesulfovibrionales bacterium]